MLLVIVLEVLSSISDIVVVDRIAEFTKLSTAEYEDDDGNALNKVVSGDVLSPVTVVASRATSEKDAAENDDVEGVVDESNDESIVLVVLSIGFQEDADGSET